MGLAPTRKMPLKRKPPPLQRLPNEPQKPGGRPTLRPFRQQRSGNSSPVSSRSQDGARHRCYSQPVLRMRRHLKRCCAGMAVALIVRHGRPIMQRCSKLKNGNEKSTWPSSMQSKNVKFPSGKKQPRFAKKNVAQHKVKTMRIPTRNVPNLPLPRSNRHGTVPFMWIHRPLFSPFGAPKSSLTSIWKHADTSCVAVCKPVGHLLLTSKRWPQISPTRLGQQRTKGPFRCLCLTPQSTRPAPRMVCLSAPRVTRRRVWHPAFRSLLLRNRTRPSMSRSSRTVLGMHGSTSKHSGSPNRVHIYLACHSNTISTFRLSCSASRLRISMVIGQLSILVKLPMAQVNP
eukprot:m.40696 g.40696  ORF g.40696 m.40696 type:complete len:343 (-) comp6013_c0_seq1:165-1193(-)